MSLKRKITLGFLISALLLAVLAAYIYVNFVEIRKEIRNLELTDTIRSKSLQLRRHEKNFFLYGSLDGREEVEIIHSYLAELNEMLTENRPIDETDKRSRMHALVGEYGERFSRIERLVHELQRVFERTKTSFPAYRQFFPLIEMTFLERPLKASEFLEREFQMRPNHRLISGLRELDEEIKRLRKNGEDIIMVSKDLDRTARANAEQVIAISQVAILVVFPLFFLSGIGVLFLISRSATRRLALLMETVERTGRGQFPHVDLPSQMRGDDEVGVLIDKFDSMEERLVQREAELEQKNAELMLTKKLAAIGTLASGVAHQLNNPLNNISLSAQVLAREAGKDCPPSMHEAVTDILGQTARVKAIVGDLLEFARGKDPQFRQIELQDLLTSAFRHMSGAVDAERVRFSLTAPEGDVMLYADPEQLERVFINLFANAAHAMAGAGDLTVTVQPSPEEITVAVSDSGTGIPKDALEKVFEPFYTTKHRGTGLGLAIVFNILKKHGADIRVESEAGRGTTFTITFPKE